jgi:hypothetical protein
MAVESVHPLGCGWGCQIALAGLIGSGLEMNKGSVRMLNTAHAGSLLGPKIYKKNIPYN